MSTDPAYLALASAAASTATVALQWLARWLRDRAFRKEVRKKAVEEGQGPTTGMSGFLWRELLRERGARHALRDWTADEIIRLRERMARLEGPNESGEQEPVRGPGSSPRIQVRPRVRSRP